MARKQKKRGPKPKPEHLKRTHSIEIMVTEAEKRSILKSAKKRGMQLSSYVRFLLLGIEE